MLRKKFEDFALLIIKTQPKKNVQDMIFQKVQEARSFRKSVPDASRSGEVKKIFREACSIRSSMLQEASW